MSFLVTFLVHSINIFFFHRRTTIFWLAPALYLVSNLRGLLTVKLFMFFGSTPECSQISQKGANKTSYHSLGI